MRDDDEDLHNPFGGGKSVPKKKHEPGIFDPDYQGPEDDPFTPTDAERDAVWDEEIEDLGTEDT